MNNLRQLLGNRPYSYKKISGILWYNACYYIIYDNTPILVCKKSHEAKKITSALNGAYMMGIKDSLIFNNIKI